MEVIEKDHAMSRSYNEPMEQGGDFSSVNSSVFVIYIQADHLYSAVTHGLSPNNPKIYAMYDQFGPTPRICFQFVKHNALLVQHKERQRKVLSNLSVTKLHDQVQDIGNLAIDSDLDTIFLVKRMSREDLIRANLNTCDGADFSYTSVEPITYAVKVALKNYLSKQSRDDRFTLYNHLKNFERQRHIADLVSESLDQPRDLPKPFWRRRNIC